VVDCTTRWWNLSPLDASECIKQAKGWEIIEFAAAKIREWDEIIFWFVLLGAQLASYALPIHFVSALLDRRRKKRAITLDGKETLRKYFWGFYLLGAGITYVSLGFRDRFMLIQGVWMIVCGVVTLLLSHSWWGALGENDATPGIVKQSGE
jgi:hypothetical protein